MFSLEEMMKCLVYMLNRCSTLTIKDATPKEAWIGAKPFVHHFRVFGCISLMHILNACRKN